VIDIIHAWLVLLFSWLLSPFTGLYLQNDHFRTLVVILSWMSLAQLWGLLNRSSKSIPISSRSLAGSLAIGTLTISLIYIVRILAAPYAFNGDVLNVLHLSHWFALAVGAMLLVTAFFFKKGTWPARNFFTGLFIGAFLIGGVALVHVYTRAFSELPNLVSYRTAIEWIRSTVPETESLCTDPAHTGFFGAHTARRVYPAEATNYYAEPTSDVVERLVTIVGFYDSVASGQAEAFLYQSGLGRGVVCEQSVRYEAALKRFGFSSAFIDRLTGCPRPLLRRLSGIVASAMEHPFQDEEAFAAICPWVIVSEDQSSYWRLPSNYDEQVFDGVSVWYHAP
jgi:hypothetical protein